MSLWHESGILCRDEVSRMFRSRKTYYMVATLAAFFLLLSWTKTLQLLLLVLFNPEKPISLSLLVPHLLLFVVLPFLTVIFGFEMLSGEVENHTARFLATRFSRTGIVLGKYAGTLGVIAAMLLVVLGIGAFRSGLSEGSISLVYPLMVWLFLVAYAAALLGVVCCVSAATSRPSTTLYILFLILLFFALLHTKKTLLFLSPFFYFRYSLSLSTMGTGILGLCMLAVLFVSASVLLFERRDL